MIIKVRSVSSANSSSTVIEPFTMSIIISTCSHECVRLCLTVVRPQFAGHQCMNVLLFPIDSQNVFDLYFLVVEIKIRFRVEKCKYTRHSVFYHLRRKYRVDVKEEERGGGGGLRPLNVKR